MALIGYARVSTADQSLDVQTEMLELHGCTIIRTEKMSGTSKAERVALNNMLDFIQSGDKLVITKIDRLARNLLDLQLIIDELDKKGASLVILNLFNGQSFDTSKSSDKLMLCMLGAFSEFETSLRKERQLEGIARAKAKGVYKGRKPKATIEAITALKDQGLNHTAIAKELGVTYRTVARIVADHKPKSIIINQNQSSSIVNT
ncbi:MAG: recombinase family protein [Saccharospirillaceae bacterium]|nr:recombinase family protein [Saccharospirillaceae bacterium]